MSDTNKTGLPGTNNGNGNGNNNSGEKPAQDANFLVKGFRWVKDKIGTGIKVVKDHPVAIAVSTALGVTAGGYAGYKLATSMTANAVPLPEPTVPELPEKKDEDETPANTVEYVDIPQRQNDEEA